MKLVSGEIAPFFTELFNRSMSAGHCPLIFIKKRSLHRLPSLDAMNVQSYRPMSNLSVVSELLERILAQQLVGYLQSSDSYLLFNPVFDQATRRKPPSSVYCLTHLTQSIRVTLPLWSSYSAAFDTVDHDILYRRLHRSFGQDGPALAWFRSYLMAVRNTFVAACRFRLLAYAAPMLLSDLGALMEQHGLCPHLYV